MWASSTEVSGGGRGVRGVKEEYLELSLGL